MARLYGSLTTSAALATGTAAKTILQLVAPANQRVAINSIAIGFKGVSVTDAPIRVRVLKQTNAGTATARTPAKTSGGSTTLQSTGQENASAEPTAGAVLYDQNIHPQLGIDKNVMGQGWELDGGERVAIEVTAAVSVNCDATIAFEE